MLGTSQTLSPKSGLLETPPLPFDASTITLAENAEKVFIKRYVHRGPDSEPVETVEETFWRVAYHITQVEQV